MPLLNLRLCLVATLQLFLNQTLLHRQVLVRPFVRASLVASNLQAPSQIRSNDRNAIRKPSNRLEELLQETPFVSANQFLSSYPLIPTPIPATLTPNNTKIPNNSTPNPISGHFIKMSSTPAQKANVPFHFCLRAKKTNVRWGPSSSVMPTRKRMLPMASRARSKKRIRPSRKKKPPPLQKATPISVLNVVLALECWFSEQAPGWVSCSFPSLSRVVGRTHSASRTASRWA